ncbi:UbiA-like protein EboC [Spongiimicrobium salis]|uniref:UbiA-like protein EboC n=1 Tax=Spongiimicrobium salis TaxID=1667022 RepID=UPI00374CFAC6
MRPANLPTAAGDIFAGLAMAGILKSTPGFGFFDGVDFWNSIILVGASVLLYAGGVVLNDVFDAKLDAVERPERPIPKGVVSLRAAALFGASLLVLGIVGAFFVNALSGKIALGLALAIITYDGFSKKYDFLGPLNMGICRSLNLLLGMSVFGQLIHWWFIGIPLMYIFAITLISRGEVHADNKKNIIFAGILYATVIFSVIGLMEYFNVRSIFSLLFLVLFAVLIFLPLRKAYISNTPKHIKKAVIAGVLSLIVLDAAMAVGFSEWWYGVLILCLMPLSIWLSKLFSVT